MSSKAGFIFPSRNVSQQSFKKTERKEKQTNYHNFYKSLVDKKDLITFKKSYFEDFYRDDIDLVETYESEETMT
jgi:hypothetical protein